MFLVCFEDQDIADMFDVKAAALVCLPRPVRGAMSPREERDRIPADDLPMDMERDIPADIINRVASRISGSFLGEDDQQQQQQQQPEAKNEDEKERKEEAKEEEDPEEAYVRRMKPIILEYIRRRKCPIGLVIAGTALRNNYVKYRHAWLCYACKL